MRPREGGGVQVEVHDILSVTDRPEQVNGHVRSMTQNAGTAQSAEEGDVRGDDDEVEDYESHITDPHESMSAQQNLMDTVPPFITPTSLIVMINPVSSSVSKTFQWKGKRLTMKFEGGWSTASYKRACNRCGTSEGYDMFYYNA